MNIIESERCDCDVNARGVAIKTYAYALSFSLADHYFLHDISICKYPPIAMNRKRKCRSLDLLPMPMPCVKCSWRAGGEKKNEGNENDDDDVFAL